MSEENGDESIIFEAVSHAARRKIIKLIGEKGSVTYKDLSKLGMEPGTLYFHLNFLMNSPHPVIRRDEKKRYILTSLGELAYKLLTETEDKITWITPREVSKTSELPIRVGEFLGFKQILQAVYKTPNTHILNAIIVSIIYGIISYYSNGVPLILMVLPYRLPLLQTVGLAVSSWITIFITSELLSRGIYKKSENTNKLLIGTIFPFIPPMISMGLNIIIRTFNLLILPGINLFTSMFFIFSEVWALWILTYTIGLAKDLKPTKAALIALIIGYINLTLLQFLK